MVLIYPGDNLVSKTFGFYFFIYYFLINGLYSTIFLLFSVVIKHTTRGRLRESDTQRLKSLRDILGTQEAMTEYLLAVIIKSVD